MGHYVGIIICWLFTIALSAQYSNPEKGILFADDEVPRVDIIIEQVFIDQILANVESNEEYPAQFIFTSSRTVDTLEEVGVRLRGNTSRGAAKKSIKVSFNSYRPGRKFYGIEKMNINGEHNDPTIMRSKLCWDLYDRIGVPASRSNHIALYVNGDYLGLYINVEHIDEEYVQKRFEDGRGNLYKCLWPADLTYKGSNPSLYKDGPYERKTNKGGSYADLANFITVLNNTPANDFQCEIEQVFDVDNYLKVVALDILTGNWDGPIVNKNNFYLYNDPLTGRFSYIPYDLDNTFGIDWFNVDWAEADIYTWSDYSVTGKERPIYTKLMENSEYRNRFTEYMRAILTDEFNISALFFEIDERKKLIQSFRENDDLAGGDYGWSYLDFLQSYDEALGAHVKYGLYAYIDARSISASNQLENSEVVPFGTVTEEWTEDLVTFNIETLEASEVTAIKFIYRLDSGPWEEVELTPDASGAASYVHHVMAVQEMEYYLELSGAAISGRLPSCGEYKVQLGYKDSPAVVINEFMASNSISKKDEAGEYDDWIELYNSSNEVAPINTYFLSDDPDDPTKWQLPNVILLPGQYLTIWADDDANQGKEHTNFKLKKEGEFLGLFDSRANHNALIDGLEYPPQETDVSYARLPNGTGDFVFEPYHTYGYNNDEASAAEEQVVTAIKVYPNPAREVLYIESESNAHRVVSLYNVAGELIKEELDQRIISLESIVSGLYIVKIEEEGRISEQKIVVIK